MREYKNLTEKISLQKGFLNLQEQGEYYLTDVVQILRKGNHRVSAFQAENPHETMGINSLKQLRQMEELLANGKIIIGGLVSIAIAIYEFYDEHKELAARIALRIEKDNADGKWTNTEKESHAVDLYFNEVIPALPIRWRLFLKIVPNFIEKKLIIYLIRKLCKASHKLKGK